MKLEDLREKAINFKGKDYVLVKDRVIYFNETYSDGCITTELLSDYDSEMVVFRAMVYPDGLEGRFFTGYSQARWNDTSSFVNRSSAMENAETSAVGRALAMMGIGVIDSVASVDEITKADNEKRQWLNEPELSQVIAAVEDVENVEGLNSYVTDIKLKYLLSKTNKQRLNDAYEAKMSEFISDIRQIKNG
jgi:hypothetical protein